MAAPFPLSVFVASAQLLAAQLNNLVTALNTINPTAKGSLFGASTVGTPVELLASAGGASGGVLVNDPSTASGLNWLSLMSAGKNAIINGGTDIWIRGTSFTPSTGVRTFTADRISSIFDGSGVVTISQQTFTPGAAPVAGYEGTYFYRMAQSTAGTGQIQNKFYANRVEDVRTLAGQSATLSFWAKADAARSIQLYVDQQYGTGGSGANNGMTPTIQTLTTSWVRYSISFAMPSIAGKTIGTGSYIDVAMITVATNIIQTIDIWGVQLELGSTPTTFSRAGGSIGGELALCQRYLPAFSADLQTFLASTINTTTILVSLKYPTTARVAPTGMLISSLSHFQTGNSSQTYGTPTALTFDAAGKDYGSLSVTSTAGSPTLVAGQTAVLRLINPVGYILFTGCEL